MAGGDVDEISRIASDETGQQYQAPRGPAPHQQQPQAGGKKYKRDPHGHFSTVDQRGAPKSKPAVAAPKPIIPVPSHKGPMKRGGTNDVEQVRQLQALLGVLGLGKPPTNGQFDAETETAVKNAQERLGMKPTGRATSALVNKLIDAHALSPCVQRSEDPDPYDLLRSALAAGDFDEPGGVVEVIDRAAMSTQDINDLPDEDFAYIEPGGSKDAEGRTVPRSLRHFPMPDADHVRNALARIGQGAEFGDEAMPALLKAAKKMGIDAANSDGEHAGRSEPAETDLEVLRYDRTWALDDIVVRSGGDGRTVEAYAAVFDTPTEIKDQHGHYLEVINRAAFNRAISHGIDRIGVFYHHGMTLHGTPSDLGSVPIGSPVEVRPDGKGLRTVSRFNKSQLADSVLEAIRAGDIRGYSFRGRIFQSTPTRVPRSRGNDLPTVTRHELGLTEYGPTPTPYYADAGILAVRSPQQTAFEDRLAALEELVRSLTPDEDPGPDLIIATPIPGPGAEDPPEQALRSASTAAIRRKIAVARILGRIE